MTHAEELTRLSADLRAFYKPPWWQIRKRWRWRRWTPVVALLGEQEPISRRGVRVD